MLARTVKILRIRYIIGLSVIALLVTASFITMTHVVSKQRNFSSLINLAGHQAGLSNRISFFVSLMATTDDEFEFNMARSQVGRAIHKMQVDFNFLRHGDPEKASGPVINDTLVKIYEDPMIGLDLAIERFLDRAKDAYSSDKDTFNTESAAYIFITTYGPHTLNPLLDAAVDEYEKLGREAVFKIEKLESIIWLTTLLTLLLEFLLIFRPMEGRVQKALSAREYTIATLKTTRKRLIAAQRLAKIGDWEFNPENKTLTWSDQVYDICGVSLGGFTVTPETSLQLVNPQDRKTVESVVNRLIETRKTSLDMEYRIIRPDGGERTVFQHAVAVKGQKGRIDLIYGTIQDITEQKKAADDKIKLEGQLSQSHKMRAIGTLAGGIAHDFNNILSAILGYAQLAKLDIQDPEAAQKDITKIENAAQRASLLVRQILTFSRQSEDTMQPMGLYLVVKEAMSMMRSSIPANIEIIQKIQSKASILADPTKIHQVIMNLCTNAYHAMEDTGGVLTVALNETDILDEESIPDLNMNSGKYVRLIVSDTGHGMDRETMKKIFDPFFTTKEVGQGTGLGLSVVDGIVKNHNGFMKVYSEIGSGTTCQIFWPIIRAKKSVDELEIKTGLIMGSERIMLVEDEVDILEALQNLLVRQGYSVTPFTEGVSALKEFKADPDKFDLVITDMTMPKMKGDAFSAELLKIRKALPIILCSGYYGNLDKDTTQTLGITKRIQKPIMGQELSAMIREIFAH
jgi:PAS domain S-box-containing protein